MESARRIALGAARSLLRGTPVDFWGIVRSLTRAHPELPRLGYAATPADEAVRFGQVPFLNFPGRDIASIETDAGKADALIFQDFFGLLGVDGPMPLEFTNYIFQRSHNYYDNTWRRFLDIIHHRFLALFYRAFAQNEQALCFDRPQSDSMFSMVQAFAGFDPRQEHPGESARIGAAFARALLPAAAGRDALREILATVFRCPLTVREFQPTTGDIPTRYRAVLGASGPATLGVNLQIGRSYYTLTRLFEIHIGPVDFNFYMLFISGFTGLEKLCRIVNLCLRRPLEYNVRFTLISDSIPRSRLGFDWESGDDAGQLGYTCYLGKPADKTIDLVLNASRFAQKRRQGNGSEGF
jgi:type VI secretion system protein ImpH